MQISEIEQALHYLLVASLNDRNTDPIGPQGNARLVNLFFSLLQTMGAPALFCDIGANDGSAAVQAKSLFPEARVVSLEANPHIHRMHADRLKSLGIDFRNVAATATEGPVRIYIPKTLSRAYINGEIVPAVVHEAVNTGKGSLLKRDEDATYEEVSVPGITLDSLLGLGAASQNERTVALWVDVEGAAYQVLQGATETLNRTTVLLIETEGFAFWHKQKMSGDVARLLMEKGFIPVSRDREYADKQFNTLFVHSTLLDKVLPALFRIEGDRSGAARPVPAARKEEAPPKTDRIAKSKSRPVRSLTAGFAADIPVYIPTFNNPTYSESMVQQLWQWGLSNIIIVDNGSTYEKMHRFLDRAEHDLKVIRLPKNAGPHGLFKDSENYSCLPELFCVTDPDLYLNHEMPQDFLLALLKLTHQHKVGKAGLALNIEDQRAFKADKFSIAGGSYHIWEWEERFWTEPVGHIDDGSPVYRADVDTTFALYNKKYFDPDQFYSAVRLAGRYTCKHLPWYEQSFLPPEEELFYRQSQKYSYYMQSGDREAVLAG